MYENQTLLEKYSAIAQTIALEKGPFKLFALFKRDNFPWEWDVVLSAEWLPGNEMESLKYIFDKIRVVLNHKEFINISKVVLLDVNEPFVKELQAFLEEHNNPKAFSNTDINNLEIREGLMIVSPISSQDEILPNSSELLTKASQWIRKAATQGDSEAQKTLGIMHLKGEGVKRNLSIAKKWFKKAAALGNVQAQSYLNTIS
jgi:hypothetical protein